MKKTTAAMIDAEINNTKKLINKAKIMGLGVQEIDTACDCECILINISDLNHIIYIPDDVTILNATSDLADMDFLAFTDKINKLSGNIKIIGGRNLINTHFMFNM